MSLILILSMCSLPQLSHGFQGILIGTQRHIHHDHFRQLKEQYPIATGVINRKSGRCRCRSSSFSSGWPLRLRTDDEAPSEVDKGVKDPDEMTEEEYKATLSSEELKEYEEQEKDFYLIQRIEAEVMAESGVGLEELINPSKVINLERDIAKLTLELEDISIKYSVSFPIFDLFPLFAPH